MYMKGCLPRYNAWYGEAISISIIPKHIRVCISSIIKIYVQLMKIEDKKYGNKPVEEIELY